MKLTKIFVVGAMLLFGTLAANAQPGMGGPGGPGGPGNFDPEQMAQMRADRMKETLKLNEDQYAKVLALYKAENEEMTKMMEQGGQPDREAFEKRREAQKAEFKKILTEDQYKQYEEEQSKMRRRGPGGPGGPGPR